MTKEMCKCKEETGELCPNCEEETTDVMAEDLAQESQEICNEEEDLDMYEDENADEIDEEEYEDQWEYSGEETVLLFDNHAY